MLYKKNMYEIELKAHLENKNQTIQTLKTFANYEGFFHKQDNYFKKQLENSEDYISVRIRKEQSKTSNGELNKIFLTYKQKELKTTKDGCSIEVNNEKECELSESSTIISILLDTNFSEYLKKEKIVEKFTYSTKYGIATIEICTIPPIGDFIELEILSNENNNSNIENIKNELYLILEKCNVPLSNIENRYYSQLLKEFKK